MDLPGFAWIVSLVAVALAAAGFVRGLRRRTGVELAERARQLEALRASLDEVTQELVPARTALESMAEGILVVDREGRVTAVNRAARHMFDIPERVRSRPLLEVVRSAEIADACARATRERAPRSATVRFAPPGEPERWLTLRAFPYPMNEGEIEGAVSVLSDVTSERHLERVRSDFVANVSHEFRTPLTALRGFAETLLSSELDAERRVRFTDTILRHAERLESLIEDLLTLAEIEAGKRELELSLIDLVAVSRSVVARLEPDFQKASVSVEVVARADPVEAWADRRALEPILQNLLVNAIKYTPEGGSVRVELSHESGAPTLRVSDSGVGIPSRDLSRVFERFYRVDRSRSRDVGGSGLGLSIAKHLVELQGGQIEVESEVEVGSTFSVELQSPEPGNRSAVHTNVTRPTS